MISDKELLRKAHDEALETILKKERPSLTVQDCIDIVFYGKKPRRKGNNVHP